MRALTLVVLAPAVFLVGVVVFARVVRADDLRVLGIGVEGSSFRGLLETWRIR